MAVALATLPLKSAADGEGDGLLATSAGTGAGFAEAGLTGAAFTGAALAGACFPAALAAGFATGLAGAGVFLATALGTGFTGAFLTAIFFTATFFSGTVLAGAFFDGAFFVAALAGAFGATFLATTFFAAGFAAAFFAGTAFFAGDLAATLFADLTTFLAAAGLVAVFVLLALFKIGPFVAAAFDLPVLTSFALAEAFPFCALAAVELRVVFAISLHQFSAVAAGCYSPRVLHQQAYFWNTCTTTCCRLYRQRECCEPIDTFAAAFLQALAQPIAGSTLPFPPQLLRLCTDCGDALRSVARQPAGRLAAAALSTPVHRRRRSGARALPLSPLPRPRGIVRCPMTG